MPRAPLRSTGSPARVAGATLLVVLSFGLSACRDDGERLPTDKPAEAGPLRVGDGDGSVSISFQGDRVLSFADVSLCVTGDDPAELLSLSAVDHTEGVSVTDFDVVTVTAGSYADLPRPLDDIAGWTTHHRVVDVSCLDGPEPGLGIEVSKTGPQATVGSFVLTYRSGGEQYDAPVEIEVTVCSDLRRCEPAAPSGSSSTLPAVMR